MAELKNEEEEHALLAKRKADLTTESKETDNEAEDLTKKQKLNSEEKKIEDNDDEEEEEFEGEDTDEDENEDEDEDEDESEDEEEHSNGEAQIDRKGKGIMKEDKGKGKLIEESDDSSEGESESDGDSDLSDDPLAEVDLDNILPSRTRRRVVQPGVYIRNDLSKDNADDSDA